MNMPSERSTYFLGFIFSVLLLGITFYIQRFDGFTPCPLCILQRFALISFSGFFFLGFVFGRQKFVSLFMSIFASLVSLIGILLSGRQVWLQHLPASRHEDCGASLSYLIQALPFDQVIVKIMQGTAECSKKGWDFLHLSLAEWSLIVFVILFLSSLWQVKRTLQR